MANFVREQGQPLPPDAISGSDWSLTDAATAARLRKMRASGIPLGEYVNGQIYRGVLTGFNKAFVIDGTKREELISQDPKSEEIIKPFAVGKDVRKWAVDYKDRWLIFTRRGIDIKRYPAIEEYLLRWKAELTPKKTGQEEASRKPGSYKWYEIQDNVAYYKAFEKPKIFYPDIAKNLRFASDAVGAYVGNTVYLISSDDPYLLGVLNSSAVEDFYVELSAQVRGGYLRFFDQYVQQIPIPDASAAERDAIAALVRKCLDAKGVGCEEWEAEIDGRVAELYGL